MINKKTKFLSLWFFAFYTCSFICPLTCRLGLGFDFQKMDVPSFLDSITMFIDIKSLNTQFIFCLGIFSIFAIRVWVASFDPNKNSITL